MTVWAFLDESGDTNIGVEKGATTHYAVGAVVVEEPDLDELRAKVDEVRRKYFQSGAMKSSSLAKNPARRLNILRALDETGYRMLGVVVDKRRIDKESGLKYRRSFKKFIDGFMYRKLFRAYPKLRIRADQHGGPRFMESYHRYLTEDQRQLAMHFTPVEIISVDDKSEVLVQAADMVAGSLRIAYGDDTSFEQGREIMSFFHRASFGIEEWPAAPRTVAALAPVDDPSDLDDIVRRAAERSAYAFLKEAGDKDDAVSQMQVEVVQELMYASRFAEEQWVSGAALATRLQERGYAECTREYVRRSLIAPLRDSKVIIASSGRGYSLASSVEDMEKYLTRMVDEVSPILKRVETMQVLLKRESFGKVDFMEHDGFRYLQRLVEAHGQFGLTDPASNEDPE